MEDNKVILIEGTNSRNEDLFLINRSAATSLFFFFIILSAFIIIVFSGTKREEEETVGKNHLKVLIMVDSIQSQSKQVRLSNDEEGREDIDSINDLPELVLSHILSFLPTKMSGATSILSKRWVDLWTTVPVLSFSSTEFNRFVESVNKVLAKHRTKSIRQFSLEIKLNSGVDEEQLETWINAVIKRKIQELKLNFSLPLGPLISLPESMFSCETLVCLELLDDIFVDVPTNVCFQCLKILRLERVCYSNDESFSRLLSGCPILEDLIVERALDDNLLTLDINMPSLKKFTVKRTHYLRRGKILIAAPLLERIELLDLGCMVSQVEELPNLVEATFDVGFFVKEVAMLIRVMSNVKFLTLSEQCFIKAYSVACFGEVVLPVYRNLVYLEITTNCLYWRGLSALLKVSDGLKTLVVHINVPLSHMGRKCDESLSESVPSCVSMSLETLKLTGFVDQDCNWKLARYFLKNAKFLKQMKIGTSFRLKKQGRRLKSLLKYPRASTACEIGFFIDS